MNYVLSMYLYVCIHECIVYIYTYACMYVCTCVYMYVGSMSELYMYYGYMYVCMYEGNYLRLCECLYYIYLYYTYIYILFLRV